MAATLLKTLHPRKCMLKLCGGHHNVVPRTFKPLQGVMPAGKSGCSGKLRVGGCRGNAHRFSMHFSNPLYCFWFIHLKKQKFRCYTENCISLIHLVILVLGWLKGTQGDTSWKCWWFFLLPKEQMKSLTKPCFSIHRKQTHIWIFHFTRAHFQHSMTQNTCAFKKQVL